VPIAYSELWVSDGGSITGLNPGFGDYSFSGTPYYGTVPGTAARNGSGNVAPNPIDAGTNVVEFDVSSAYGGLQPYFKHINPSNGGNGRINLSPYTYLTFSVWPTRSGQTLTVYFEHAIWFNGVSTGGSGAVNTITDAAQNWPTNQFAGWSFADNTAGLSQTPISTNTATTVTFNNGAQAPLAVGDYYEIQEPDQSIGQKILLPNASYGPATMTVGQWNTYTIPLTAFNSSTAGNVAGNLVLKFGIADSTGVAQNTLYFCNIGYK